MNSLSIFRYCAVRLLLFVLASSLAGFASVVGTFDRSFQVNGPVDLEVLTRSGDITIRNGSSNTVSIRGKIHQGNSWLESNRKADVEELQKNPPLRQTGNSIRVDYVNLRNVSVDYEITVPENTTVRTHSGSGNQSVEGLKGTVDLEAGSGNITVSGVNGGFRAEAGSGDIRGNGTPKNLWNIRTGSGNVDLRVPSEAGFDVDISSNSGTVVVDHPVTTTVQGRVQERKSVVGKVRNGGPTISVHTGSGDIRLD